MEAGVLLNLNKLNAGKLKTSDVAHLTDAMCELIFLLEKNGSLTTNDAEHINSMLYIRGLL
jgi:hypothetical protein